MSKMISLEQLTHKWMGTLIQADDETLLNYAVARNIYELRKERKVIQSWLSKRSGVALRRIELIEAGEASAKLSELTKIAAALDARVEIRIVPK